MNDDGDLIRKQLDDRIEQVIARYFPGSVTRGGLAYLAPKSPRDLGSFQVRLRDSGRSRRASWVRYSEDISGGSVELLAYGLTGSPRAYAEAFREARAFLGLSGERPSEPRPERRHRRPEEEAEAEEKRRRARMQRAGEVWESSGPVDGTLGEQYLEGRGLPRPPEGWGPSLRFHGGLSYELEPFERPVFPCLVARVDDIGGDLCGVWRVYLDPETGRKAKVEKPKLGLGATKGGGVRLGGAGPHIGMAEGIETALAVSWITGHRFPVWAGLSTSGVAGLDIPLFVERITAFPDGDSMAGRKNGEYVPRPVPPGLAAAQTLIERAHAAGLGGTIQNPPASSDPQGKADFLDVWNKTRELWGSMHA